MDEMTKKEAATAWGWLLEALAGFKEVGLPLLHDLIEMAPDLPDGLERKVSERVALRTLEDLFPPRNDVLALLPSASASSSTSPLKFSFDFSERCEDVLQRIINETPECDVKTDGPGLLKWDVQAFILHKRASMPKCVLGQIKDSILDGTHPYADFLIRKSGLASNRDGCNDGVSVSGGNRRFKGSCSNARNTRVEGNDANVLPSKRVRISSDGNVAGGNCVRVNDFDDSLRIAMKMNRVQNTRVEGNEANVLPSKRDRVGPDIGNLVDENHVTVNDSDDSLRNAKKMKGGASFVSQCVEHNPVSLPQREQLEDLSERDVSVIESERCVLGPNSCGLNREDIIPTSQLESPCAAEGRDDVEHCLEATTSGVVHPVETQHTVCAKDSDCNREHGSQVKVVHAVSADGSPRKTIADGATEIIDIHSESRDSDEHNNGEIDVTTKKHGFLTSQCTLNRAYSETTDWMEENICVKCNEGAQLLICTIIDCPLAYHEKCLGSEFICYEKGNFICPLCSHSLAFKKYLESKKETSRLKKNLDTFMCSVLEQQPVEFLGRKSDDDLLEKRLRNGNLGEKHV
ncbi:uncharacterized protein LOC103939004 [Pyrus x bretschneideri]|uniref:uncharacterized protein LOC103939004 n=1 Tax=Pyrus x bretschneideri TaxID=225117 RepID=UPI00202F797B|nr:uncharacterized protein LOC103939004 [Pyrus x bretschneideri]